MVTETERMNQIVDSFLDELKAEGFEDETAEEISIGCVAILAQFVVDGAPIADKRFIRALKMAADSLAILHKEKTH